MTTNLLFSKITDIFLYKNIEASYCISKSLFQQNLRGPSPSIINWVILCENPLPNLHSRTIRARELTFLKKVHLHPAVMCQVSHVTCQVWHTYIYRVAQKTGNGSSHSLSDFKKYFIWNLICILNRQKRVDKK